MKLYTKTGDDGTTGLFGGERVSKDATRVEAYGAVDECNTLIGVIRAHGIDSDLDAILHQVQSDLFVLGADLATPDNPDAPAAVRARIQRISEAETTALEYSIDTLTAEVPPLTSFILPGGSLAAATAHQARTVARRAERRITTAAAQGLTHSETVRYTNRLSDFLFVLARTLNHRANHPETRWDP